MSQVEIIKKYKKINQKGAFLKACALKQGFKRCAQWVKKGEVIPVKHEKEFLNKIEIQLKFDLQNKKNYEQISR